jgi:hypothetical protein
MALSEKLVKDSDKLVTYLWTAIVKVATFPQIARNIANVNTVKGENGGFHPFC